MGMDPITLSAIIAGGVALASTGAQVGMTATAPKPKAPALPTPKTDAVLTSEVDQAESQRQRLAASRKGQNSTILTSPLGEDAGATSAPSLLGS